MKSLIYDTETTGLPDWKLPSEHPSQPRVTQLCAELIDDETREVLAGFHTLIKPDGWTVPEDLEKLTGITTAKCEAMGMPVWIVLPMFFEMWKRADQRIAHNESFDMRMLRIEIMRCKAYDATFADKWKASPAFCTCEQSKIIINLPPTPKMVAKGMTTPKPPNLGEAYKHFTGTELVNAHNAAVDVAACKAVYFGIREAQRAAA